MNKFGNAGVQNNPPSRVIYIGSIPYDQTEEQILDLCSNVGPVVNLKMMFDPQTGRSKGYAFVEYKDLETSASAVRNLNGYQVGSRLLKCGYSSNSDISGSAGNDNNDNSNIHDINGNLSNGMMKHGGNVEYIDSKFLNLPNGVDVNINMTTPAMMISSELAKIDKSEQLVILDNFQKYCSEHEEEASELLNEFPQLIYSIAELLLTNGVCKTDDLIPLTNSVPSSGNAGDSDETGKSNAVDKEMQEKQKNLLRQVLQLSDSEIAILPDDERMGIWDIKQKVLKGEFGSL
ncbi:hypothetical protein TPHA_0K01870 [Tetrapisispora phaffii CBS 4417]|uniref:RRM domain-containing protein n=1 Tax=Tetrapisispora phaffii (strain ATCC 24235 / CBS 4417 / NBRC 1672 / NRRL Y-8282 / UCD 70-5) TaxID=1071381 RepID=G8BZJ1_TETPH|nr:hypothetical protein TPHA_0K01870 [Tetrapisispora phaffii CBS 4417]CCE65319.1 hypothetical protein TPHA_0K01870 [Tetrapisispora phaffii CBS 4417]